MGDKQKDLQRVDFEPRLRLAVQGANISSDTGLLVYRELDEAVLACSPKSAPLPSKTKDRTRRYVFRPTVGPPAGRHGFRPTFTAGRLPANAGRDPHEVYL